MPMATFSSKAIMVYGIPARNKRFNLGWGADGEMSRHNQDQI